MTENCINEHEDVFTKISSEIKNEICPFDLHNKNRVFKQSSFAKAKKDLLNSNCELELISPCENHTTTSFESIFL